MHLAFRGHLIIHAAGLVLTDIRVAAARGRRRVFLPVLPPAKATNHGQMNNLEFRFHTFSPVAGISVAFCPVLGGSSVSNSPSAFSLTDVSEGAGELWKSLPGRADVERALWLNPGEED